MHEKASVIEKQKQKTIYYPIKTFGKNNVI